MRNMYKKIVCLSISLLLIFSFSSCQILTSDVNPTHLNTTPTEAPSSTSTEPPTEPATAVNNLPAHASKYYEGAPINHGYNSLQTELQITLYHKISSAVYDVGKKKSDNGKYPLQKIIINTKSLTEADIRVVLEAFICDHPQLFWLANLFAYSISDIATVQLYSEYLPDEIEKNVKKLNKAIEDIISKVPKKLSEFDRELLVHDLFLEQCDYSEDVKIIADDKDAFSIYGALVNKKAVCEGYAKAMQYLLSCVGIECATVNGKSENEMHKWNIVKIDNQWYHLDPTWDDNNEFIIYNYFNLDDELIKTDHIIANSFNKMTDEEICGGSESDLFNLDIPECKTLKNNYYNIKATPLHGFDDKSTYIITTALYNAVAENDIIFHIKVDDSLDFEDTVQKLFYEDPYKFFRYVEIVNEDFGEDIIGDNLSMLTNDIQHTIQIMIKYN
ncbi:hypothetical protein AGMMS50284_4040 [Clostridia bacterium]|nr:hypothetical protein AGMMS50284_4040 [Clostridia bacterium]